MKRIVLLFCWSILVNFSFAQTINNFTKFDNCLLKKMTDNKSLSGYVIVVESNTGKVINQSGFSKSIEGFVKDTSIMNKSFVPGDLMLPISFSTLINNHQLKINDSINIENGSIELENQKINDNENRGVQKLSYKDVITYSSNVGIAKSVYKFYKNSPDSFLKSIQLLVGADTIVYSKNNLVNWSYGYNFKLTPKQLLYFYNSVAQHKLSGSTKINECLVDVCKYGTGKKYLSNIDIAGKTGTIKNTNNTYTSAFIGYYPASNSKYTIMVFINNSKNSPKYYGGDIAGSLVKDIISELK